MFMIVVLQQRRSTGAQCPYFWSSDRSSVFRHSYFIYSSIWLLSSAGYWLLL